MPVLTKQIKAMKPRSLKSALESGYVIKSIMYAGSKRCLAKLEYRYGYTNGKPSHLSFWINSDYVKRTYPNTFEAKAIL